MKTNIGGSILPSSSPQILEPMPHKRGTLQVIALPEADTHALTLKTALGVSIIATHSNGYSCHNLGERMIAGDPVRVQEQAEYIQACGGTAREISAILELI
jgi:hypothetical protein